MHTVFINLGSITQCLEKAIELNFSTFYASQLFQTAIRMSPFSGVHRCMRSAKGRVDLHWRPAPSVQLCPSWGESKGEGVRSVMVAGIQLAMMPHYHWARHFIFCFSLCDVHDSSSMYISGANHSSSNGILKYSRVAGW